MKPQAPLVLAIAAVLSLSACSQHRQAPTSTSSSSKQYYVNTADNTASRVHKPAPQRVVYRHTRTPDRAVANYRRPAQRPVYRQTAPRRAAPAKRIVRAPSRPARLAQRPAYRGNPAQVNLKELYAIGDKIFQNESGGRIDQLVHWNKRENFASMGIGHFTWYPSGRRARFGNTFPGLLDYMVKKGVKLPAWVQRARFEGAPWRNRSQLMRAKHDPQVKQFAQLLYDTRHIQAQYIMDRAMRAMPRLVKKTPPHLRGHVANNLNAVANTPGGRYVLIDYVNFKGEGLNRHGGYKGHNWGLLQVLEEMQPAQPGPQALHHFADAAMRVLERRVRNSDPARNERKWLAGWRNRTNTYRSPI
jgi:hypothetical protein